MKKKKVMGLLAAATVLALSGGCGETTGNQVEVAQETPVEEQTAPVSDEEEVQDTELQSETTEAEEEPISEDDEAMEELEEEEDDSESNGSQTVIEDEGSQNDTEQTDTSAPETESTAQTIDDEIAEVEAQAAVLEQQLDAAMTQTDMNQITSDLYTLWDTQLNSMWSRIETTVDADTFVELQEEENQWVAYKEKEVNDAGEANAEGTMQMMEENRRGADLTKERVYDLAEYLR